MVEQKGLNEPTINSSMIHLRLDTNQMGVFNAYSQVNLMDQLVVFQNTRIQNPIMLSTGNNTITVGLEGQVRYNIENEEVQVQTERWMDKRGSSIDGFLQTQYLLQSNPTKF